MVIYSVVNEYKTPEKRILLHLQTTKHQMRQDYTDRRLPLVGAVSAKFCRYRGVTWSAQLVPTVVNLK
jgi:hypothetical protein